MHSGRRARRRRPAAAAERGVGDAAALQEGGERRGRSALAHQGVVHLLLLLLHVRGVDVIPILTVVPGLESLLLPLGAGLGRGDLAAVVVAPRRHAFLVVRVRTRHLFLTLPYQSLVEGLVGSRANACAGSQSGLRVLPEDTGSVNGEDQEKELQQRHLRFATLSSQA